MEEYPELVSSPSDLYSSPSEIINDYVYPENKVRDVNELTRHVLAPIDLHDGADDTINHKDTEEVLENVMRGSYAYVGADGLPYMIDWFADDEGFHPSAPHPSNYVELVSDHAGDVVDTKVDATEAEFQSSEDILRMNLHLMKFSAFPAMIFQRMAFKWRILSYRRNLD